MPDAAPALVPPAAPADPRFDRTPTVRQAWALLMPQGAKITITEIKAGGRVALSEAGSGIERTADLNVRELRELAQHANRIARLVACRPEWKP